MQADRPAPPEPRDAVLAVTREVALELHPGRELSCTLDSSLERDLGIDSLGRVELGLRLAQRLGITLPEHLALEAETPRELLLAAQVARPLDRAPDRAAPSPAVAREPAVAAPRDARTLADALLWHAARHPDRVHMIIEEESGPSTPVTYGALLEAAEKIRGRAILSEEAGAPSITAVSSGLPLPGHEIRVVDAAGRELGEREEGAIEFRGPSATCGYFRNAAATRALFDGAWLETGDRGYLPEGEIFVTGRSKDVIIRAGRHVFPYEIEAAVGRVPGVRRGNVAVFPAGSRAGGTERLVVLAETRAEDPRARAALGKRIEAEVLEVTGAPADEIVLAPPGTVLKTSSGKIRRAACRALHERGVLGRAPPVWRQVLDLLVASVVPTMGRSSRRLGSVLYASWCWFVLGVFAPAIWIGAVLPPGLARRRRIHGALSRALLRALGARARVRLEESPLPEAPVVVVANHTSYVDVIVLAAALPFDCAMVAKRELFDRILLRPVLRRLGVVGVDRFHSRESAEDARRLQAIVDRGGSLVFFPEGTLARGAGVQAFHLGAFRVAAEAQVPVVPVSIRGARSMLRPEQWFVRRSALSVTVHAAIRPQGSGWEEALRLRDLARAAIIQGCGEPDLGQAADYAKPPRPPPDVAGHRAA